MILTRRVNFILFLSCFALNISAASIPDSPLNRRDDVNATSSDNSTILEPILPPDVNPKDFDIFKLDKNVTLAWAGSPDPEPGTKRLRKRDNAIFSQAKLSFQYPVVPLDHSAFVSGISCSKGSLSGVISNTAAYNYAKSQWKGAGKILFITSVDGCGDNSANDFFLSRSVAFEDGTKTFTATGSSAEFADVYQHLKLDFGNIGTLNTRRARDKRAMFEPHIVSPTATSSNTSPSRTLEKRLSAGTSMAWHYYLNDDDVLGTDEDAPWPNAARLASWGKLDGEPDDSYEKGEVADPNGHHKRWDNITLAERDLTYGLILYCVECGFGGNAELTGTIEVSFPVDVDKAQIQFTAAFQAGLNLGLQAFVKYEQEWPYDFPDISLWKFGIPGIASVDPYIGLGIKAGVSIEATGTLLIGASVSWDNIDILIDLKDSSNSHSDGLVPTFEHKNEATGELKMSASLGLPISIGAKLSLIGGLWEAKGGVVDTPSVVLEGSFEISATITDDGEIQTDVEGDCYGIAWNIHFENTLEVFIEADLFGEASFPLIDPMESDPIAEGCIGYVNDGTGSNGAEDEGGMGGTGMTNGDSGLFGDRTGSKPLSSLTPLGTKKTGTKNNKKPTKQKGSTQRKSKNSGKKATNGKSSASKKPSGTTGKEPTKTQTATTKSPQVAKAKQSTPTKVAKPSTAAKKAPTCMPSAVSNTQKPPRTVCGKTVTKAKVPSSHILSTTSSVKNLASCAQMCLKNKQCLSFGFAENKTCQLYGENLKSLGVTSGRGKKTSSFYDRKCYKYSKCSK